MSYRYHRLTALMAATGAMLAFGQPVGHEYRQDDWPSLTATPDGAVWVTFLSFSGDRDDIGLRRLAGDKWGALSWVPGTSGDAWMPQLASDSSGRIWVIWSQQVNGNWDLYARRFDPGPADWGPLERLTSDTQPDIHPRAASRDGRIAVVWQAFRSGSSNVFLRTFDGSRWSAEVRVTSTQANDWEPAVALDARGTAWIGYDSYRNGNYDVFLSSVREGKAGPEIAVATTPNFEARASVAIDAAGRVWVAWESGPVNWGKDQGYILRNRQPGAFLESVREPRLRCYDGARWHQAAPLPFPGKTYQPSVISDGRESVWLVAQVRRDSQPPTGTRDGYMPNFQRGYWEYVVTHLDGAGWSAPVVVPNSRGRLSTRSSGLVDGSGRLMLAWSSDNRADAHLHRPLRQQVFAAPVAGPPSSAGSPALQPAVEEQIEARPAHADEPGDLRAIHAHVLPWRGRKLRILRGDFHRHTELSWDTGGGFDGSLQDFYRYMIDAARMDFGASTDHQGGLWPYWWWYSQKMTDLHHAPGTYTSIFGYERSVTFPNGHRNIFFARRAEARVIPFFLKPDAKGFTMPVGPSGDEPTGTGDVAANDTRLLYDELRGRNALAVSHTSGNRMGTDWRDNHPLVEPVVEIFQGCRTSFEQMGAPYAARLPDDEAHIKLNDHKPEGMVSNAWAKGYKLGVIASSDHFSTHISYAMVYTDDPSREGILDAIRRRHTYGATDNIVLDVRLGEHMTGDEFVLRRPEPLRVQARGTRAVAKVEVIKDSQVVYATEPKRREVEFEFLDRGDVASRHYYYVRLLQEDGMIAWSSPMFVNYR